MYEHKLIIVFIIDARAQIVVLPSYNLMYCIYICHAAKFLICDDSGARGDNNSTIHHHHPHEHKSAYALTNNVIFSRSLTITQRDKLINSTI